MILNHNAILTRVVSAISAANTLAGSRIARGPGKTGQATPSIEIFILGGKVIDHSGGKSVRLQIDSNANSPRIADMLGEEIDTVFSALTGGSPDVQAIEEEEPDEQSQIIESKNGSERTTTHRRIYTITYY